MRDAANRKNLDTMPSSSRIPTLTVLALAAAPLLGACGERGTRGVAEPATSAAVGDTQAEQPVSVDPRDADIPDVCTGGPARLQVKGGGGSYDSKLGEGMKGSFEVSSLGKADLDADGVEEILALVLCQPGGSGTHDAVWAFHSVGGRLEQAGRIDGGDRANGGLARAELQGNKIAIERNAGGEAACCADKTVNEVWGYTKAGFVKEKSEPGASSAPSPAQTLAADLLKGRQQLGWSAAKNQIAYAVTIEEEGTGTVAWNVGFLDLKTDKEVELVEVCQAAGSPRCSEAALAAQAPDLVKRLDGFVAVAGTEARPGEATKIAGTDLTLTQEKANVSIAKGAGKKARLGKLKEEANHKPEITRVWYLPEAKAVVVRVLMNPGKKFGELNVFEQTRAFALPAGL